MIDKQKELSRENAELGRKQIEDIVSLSSDVEVDRMPKAVQYGVKLIESGNDTIPKTTSINVVNYVLANFVGQFHPKIIDSRISHDKIPPNYIGFSLLGSGNGKDSSMLAVRGALENGYMKIDSVRKQQALERAKAIAEEKEVEDYMKFYKKPETVDKTVSTVEGMVRLLNQFESEGLGMPSVFVGELGTELQTNKDMIPNIKLVSELYDIGHRKSKAIKDTERQDSEVSNMGMSAFFHGSEDNILRDDKVKSTFSLEFVTKLARRTFFNYPFIDEKNERIKKFYNFEEVMKDNEKKSNDKREARDYFANLSEYIADGLLGGTNAVSLSEDAWSVYQAYKFMCENSAEGYDFDDPMLKTEIASRHWKSIKLAGVYALVDGSATISKEHISSAIYWSEFNSKYLNHYLNEASKEAYELMVDDMKSGKYEKLTLHKIKKKNLISSTSNYKAKVRELASMANSLMGDEGVVKWDDNEQLLVFEQFTKIDTHKASYVKVSGNKESRARMCHEGFVCKDTEFEKLANLMKSDTAYTPFCFKDGKRSNDNIQSGATWIAIDVDDTDITIDEMHDALADFKHHISTTSDSSNIFKYRIILELDVKVDLDPIQWKKFLKKAYNFIGVENADPAGLTKSQIMFGYKDSVVYSVTDEDCDKLPASRLIQSLEDDEAKETKLPPKSIALEDIEDTFFYAINPDRGQGSLSLYKASRHAKDIGLTYEENENLMFTLNALWDCPMDEERLHRTILVPLKRTYDD
jgi:hypothetical protein